MTDDDTPTTRRYPRTLLEAWPGHQPESIYPPPRRGLQRMADSAMAIVLGLLGAVALAHWLTS